MTDKLRLEVILDAIDKATAPMQKVMKQSEGLSRAMKQTREQLKQLNGLQGQVDLFHKLGKDSAITANQLKGLQERVQALDKAMEGGGNKAMARELAKLRREEADLNGKTKTLNDQLQQTRERMTAAGISVENLTRHEFAMKAGVQLATNQLKEQEAALAKLNARMKATAAARASYDRTMGTRNRLFGAGAEMAGAGAATAFPLFKMVKDYVSFEDAMQGVARQVEGARDANGGLTKTYFEMADSIKVLSKHIPMATTEIAALVEAGARMGVTGKDNLLKFAEITAMTATAFDLPVEKIGEDMGQLANLYKIPIAQISKLGDVINWLDDNALSKGGDIIDVMKRIAGTAATVNMPFKESAALGSTFLTLGSSAEVAATASNAMMRELAIAAQQPKRFQAGMAALHLNSKTIQSSMAKDATGTIQQVLEAINKLPDNKQLSVTTQLFGKEYGDDAAKLANNLEEYRRQLSLTQDARSEGSMQRESGAKNDTVSAQYQMTQNRLFNTFSQLGETLRNPIMESMQQINAMLESVNQLAKAHPRLTGALIKTGIGMAAVLSVVSTLSIAMAAFLGPIAISRFMLTSLGIRASWLGSNFGALSRMVEWTGHKFMAMWPIAKTGLSVIGNVLLSIGRLAMANPLIAFISVLAIGAIYVWRNWETLGPKFHALLDKIKMYFVTNLGYLVNDLYILKDRFMTAGSEIVNGLWNGLKSRWESLKAWLSSAMMGLSDTAKSVLGIHSPSRVFMGIGSYTMQGMADGLARNTAPFDVMRGVTRQLAGIGAGMALTLPSAGSALADGRAFSALDHRPPLAKERRAASSSTAGGGNTFHFHVYPSKGMDETALARLVAEEVQRLQYAEKSRRNSRLSDFD